MQPSALSQSNVPTLSLEDTQRLLALHKKRPGTFTDQKVAEIVQAARTYGLDPELKPEDPNYFVEVPKQLLGGFIKEFTIFVDPFDEPKTPVTSIAKSVGGVFGFVGSFFGVARPLESAGAHLASALEAKGAAKMIEGAVLSSEKTIAAGKAMQKAGKIISSVEMRSMPMLAADLATKGLKKLGAYEAAMGTLRGTHPMLQQMVEEGIHLGIASAASAMPEGLPAMIHSGLFGAVSGGAFAGIGNIPELNKMGSLDKVVKAAAGSIFQGLPSTIQGQTGAEQIYNYLLGGYFGYHAQDVKTFQAVREMSKIPYQDQRNVRTLSDVVKRVQSGDLPKDVYDRMVQMSEQTHKRIPVRDAFSAIFESQGGAGQMAKKAFDDNLTIPENSAIIGDKGEKVGTVVAVNDDGTVTVKGMTGRIFNVMQKDVIHRVVEVEDDLKDLVEAPKDKPIMKDQANDLDSFYADLSDPVVKFMKDAYGQNITRTQFMGLKKGIDGKIDELALQARSILADDPSKSRAKVHEAMMTDFKDYLKITTGGKEVDTALISQYLTRRINSAPVGMLHLKSNGTMRLLPLMPGNTDMVVTPNLNTKNVAHPQWEIQTIFQNPYQVLKLDSWERINDRTGAKEIATFEELPASDIMRINESLRQFSLKDGDPKGDYYLAAGNGEKTDLVALKYLFNQREATDYLQAVGKQHPEMIKEYKLMEDRAFKNGGISKAEFARQYASNMEYYRRTILGDNISWKDAINEKDPLTGKSKFINSVLDFNKRQQIQFNTFYPVSPGILGQDRLSFIIANDLADGAVEVSPEAESIISHAAKVMRTDLAGSIQSKGMNMGEFGAEEPGTKKVVRWNVSTSPQWFRDMKATKESALKALDEVIAGNPVSKLANRIYDLIVNQQLYGIRDPQGGDVPPNQDYIDALKKKDKYFKVGDKFIPIDIEVTDGGSYVLQRHIDSMTKGYNLPTKGGISKTFIYHNDPDLGIMMNKHALHGIDPKSSKLAAWMEANGIDMIHFRTATKQIGKREVRQLQYDGKNYSTTGGNTVYSMPTSDLRLSWQVYDKGEASGWETFPKQMWTNSSDLRGGAGFSEEISSIMRAGALSTKEGREILETYRNTKSPEVLKRIFQWNKDGSFNENSLAFQIGSEDLLKMMREDRAFETQALGYIARNSIRAKKDSNEVEMDGEEESSDKEVLNDLNTTMDILRFNPGEGIDRSTIYINNLNRLFNRLLHNFFVKRITRPRVTGSAKAIMRIWEPELLHDRVYDKGVFYLDNGHKNLEVDGFDPKTFASKKTTLEELYNLSLDAQKAYERMQKKNPGSETAKSLKQRLDQINDALEAVAVRVPMDDMGGARVLRFGGFTNRKGSGVLLHHEVMKSLGGADNDIDSATILFGKTKKVKDGFRKVENDYRNFRQKYPYIGEALKSTNQELLDIVKNRSIWQAFDPYGRTRAGIAVSLGRGKMLPIVVSSKFKMQEFYLAVKRAAEERGPEGYLELPYGDPVQDPKTGKMIQRTIKLTPRNDNGEMLNALGSVAVNQAADLAGIGGMVNEKELAAMLFHAAFEKAVLQRKNDPRRDYDALEGTQLDYRDPGVVHSRFLPSSLIDLADTLRFNIREYASLHDANSALYGSNRAAGRAWTPAEIKDILTTYDDHFYRGRPLTEIVKHVRELDYGYDYLRDFATDPAILENMVKKVSAFNDLMLKDPDVRAAYGWLAREDGESVSHVVNRYKVLANQQREFNPFNRTDRIKLARDKNIESFKRLYRELYDTLKDPDKRKDWRNAARSLFDVSRIPGEPSSYKDRLRFLEGEIRLINDIIGTRYQELASYTFLSDAFKNSGLGGLADSQSYGRVLRYVKAMMTRANFIKREYASLWADAYQDKLAALGVTDAVPEYLQKLRNQDMEAKKKKLAEMQDVLKMLSDRQEVWQASRPNLEHYLGADGFSDPLTGELTPQGAANMARYDMQWRDEGRLIDEQIAQQKSRVQAMEDDIIELPRRWHEVDVAKAKAKPRGDLADIIRMYEIAKDKVARTADLFEKAYGMPAKGITDLFDAFMLSDISFTKEAWHQNLGMKVVNDDVIRLYKQNYQEAYNTFGGAPSDLSTNEQVRRWVLRQRKIDEVTETSKPTMEYHDRVFWELLPKDKKAQDILDPEVRSLAISITEKLKKFPQINAEDLMGIIRYEFKIAQPDQLDIFHLRGLDAILDSWLQGPGIVNEYLGWLRSENGKGQKPPQFMDWIQFIETVADKHKKDMLILTVQNLYNAKGELNMNNAPLYHYDEALGKSTFVMARQVVAETPLHMIQNTMRKASSFSMQYHALARKNIHEKLGWITRGIKGDDGKDYAGEFFDYAVRRHEINGAEEYIASLKERRKRNSLDDPLGPVTQKDIDVANDRLVEATKALMEKKEFYDNIKGRVFNVENLDPSQPRENLTGDVVVKRAQERLKELIDQSQKYIAATPELLKESLVLDYESGHMRVNPFKSWKNFEEYFRQNKLDNPLPYDLGQFSHNTDTKHFYSLEMAKEHRRMSNKLYHKDGSAKFDGEAAKLRKKWLNDIENFAQNDEIQKAASYFPEMKKYGDFAERRVWLYTYMDILKSSSKDEAIARINNILGEKKKYKGISHIDPRKSAARSAAKNLDLDPHSKEEMMDHAWTVQQYLYKYWDPTKHVYQDIYKQSGMSMYELDRLFAEGGISPEMYFYKRKEWEEPFMKTTLIQGYWPHMDHPEAALHKWADAQVERIKKQYGPVDKLTPEQSKAMQEDLGRVNDVLTRNRLFSQSEDGYLNVNHANALTAQNNTATMRKMLDLTGQRSGNMLQRTHNIPGYGRSLEQLEKYFMKLGRATYNTFAAFHVRRIIEKFEKMGAADKWMGKKATPAWSFYFRAYFRDVLGYPTIFTNDQWTDPILKLSKTPYGFFSDHMAFVKGTTVRKAAIQLLKLDKLTKTDIAILEAKYRRELTPSELEREKADRLKVIMEPTEKNMEDYGALLRNLSVLESQYQMATLLFSSRSAFGNIYGAAVNTGVWTGMQPMIQAQDFKVWKTINSDWKSMKDVYDWVISTGVMEEFLIHEGNALNLQYGPKFAPFVDDVIKKIKKDPHMEDTGLVDIAKKHGIAENVLNTAAFFMRKTERFARVQAFLSTYLQARANLDAVGVPIPHAMPWLLDTARKGVEATQFLYSNIDRPAFARTNLGHIYSRFKLWSWSNVKFQRKVYEAARNQGMRPGSPEMDRLRRLMTANLFALGLASLLPFTIFDAALPAPLSYLQNLADWMFGDSKERERAFFSGSTGLPVAIAPLNELLPPIARIPKGIVELPDFFSSIWSGDYKHAAHLTTVTLFPFGRMGKDLWRAYDDPAMAVDVLTGMPLNTLARMKAKKKKRDYAQEKAAQEAADILQSDEQKKITQG